jgi:hypothetical protein
MMQDKSSDRPEAAGRLQRALDAFQKGQGMLLAAHRKLRGLPPEEVDRFWLSAGARLEAHMNGAAVEVQAAFRAFSDAGLVAKASDRHLVTEARRHLSDSGR